MPAVDIAAFASLRPSERVSLKELALTDPDRFHSCLMHYLQTWALSDWVDYYRIERLGRWMSAHLPEALNERCRRSARARLGANAAGDTLPPSVWQVTWSSFDRAFAS